MNRVLLTIAISIGVLAAIAVVYLLFGNAVAGVLLFMLLSVAIVFLVRRNPDRIKRQRVIED